ncbi:hypothetical protein SOVF_032920 [Spinacia oleracea]|nr:hypothetical protein SOVF_032920 [Spinacia oleracea]
MANSNHIAKKNKLIKLKLVMKNLQSCFSLWKRLPIYISYDILSSRITTLPLIMSDVEELQDQHDHEEASSCHFGDSKAVVPPQDVVKEGHFAVVAVDGVETKRFMVPLSYLTHPMFLVLLEKAAEEYGFDHEGALTIPCTPTEIDNILAESQELRLISKYTFDVHLEIDDNTPHFHIQPCSPPSRLLLSPPSHPLL